MEGRSLFLPADGVPPYYTGVVFGACDYSVSLVVPGTGEDLVLVALQYFQHLGGL